jgi:hypothetical protein
MPVDGLDHPVGVLLELPRETALADAARSDDRHEAGSGIPAGRGDEVLEHAQLFVAAGEGRFWHVRPALPAPLGHDPQRPPGRHWAALALQVLLADGFEGDGRRRGPHGPFAHDHRTGRGRGLQPRGRVDEIAGDHPLVARAERDRGFSGHDPDPRVDPGTEGPHGRGELQSGTDRAFRVVLVGDRRAPHGHHRVADELLDRPPVPSDDVAGQLEVPTQRVANILRVALLGERGEAHEVREEDADEPSLGHGPR